MITPFHIVAATPIKLLFPKHFSLLWFSIVNILIDIEVVYYFLTIDLITEDTVDEK